MTVTVIYPSTAHRAYKIAAEAFASLAKEVSGDKVELVPAEKYVAPSGDLTVFIGNDEANCAIAGLLLEKKADAFGIRYGTDDYAIRTGKIDGSKILMLVGARPRAVIYAVYRYFELYCGCRWFWDGDRIKNAPLAVEWRSMVKRALQPAHYHRS